MSMAGTCTGLAAEAWTTHLARGTCAGRGGTAGADQSVAHREEPSPGRGPGSASSACRLRGDQLSRPEETERSLQKTQYIPSKSWAWLCNVQEEDAHWEHPSRTPHSGLSPSSLLFFPHCPATTSGPDTFFLRASSLRFLLAGTPSLISTT